MGLYPSVDEHDPFQPRPVTFILEKVTQKFLKMVSAFPWLYDQRRTDNNRYKTWSFPRSSYKK